MLKRAADLAEALYSMPRNPNQISLPPPRSPAINNSSPMSSFNTYTGQLAVSVQDPGGQWEEGMYNIVVFVFVLCTLCCQFLWIVFLRLVYPMLPVSLDLIHFVRYSFIHYDLLNDFMYKIESMSFILPV